MPRTRSGLYLLSYQFPSFLCFLFLHLHLSETTIYRLFTPVPSQLVLTILLLTTTDTPASLPSKFQILLSLLFVFSIFPHSLSHFNCSFTLRYYFSAISQLLHSHLHVLFPLPLHLRLYQHGPLATVAFTSLSGLTLNTIHPLIYTRILSPINTLERLLICPSIRICTLQPVLLHTSLSTVLVLKTSPKNISENFNFPCNFYSESKL